MSVSWLQEKKPVTCDERRDGVARRMGFARWDIGRYKVTLADNDYGTERAAAAGQCDLRGDPGDPFGETDGARFAADGDRGVCVAALSVERADRDVALLQHGKRHAVAGSITGAVSRPGRSRRVAHLSFDPSHPALRSGSAAADQKIQIARGICRSVMRDLAFANAPAWWGGDAPDAELPQLRRNDSKALMRCAQRL